jgi:hypothetical protein
VKIPTGNFGYSVPDPVDNSAVSRATDRLGQIVTSIGQQRNEQAQALARARDASAYQEHALAVDELKAHYAEKIDSGEIRYDTAQSAFEGDAAKITAPKPTARDPVAAEALTRGTQMSIKRASLDISHVANGARDKDMQAQGIAMLDTLGKRVSVPGADVDAINAQADAVGPVLRSGGVNEAQVSRTIQNFKDANWYNQATQVAMQSRESLSALKQLEHDLTAKDGFYVTRLDTEKRNAVLQQVISHRIQLENKLQASGDRREAKAERAAAQIEQQISSGVPATANMWSDWGDAIKGTSVEPQFKDLIASEHEIQNTLRAPIADQVRLVQQKQADLDTHGGTLAQAANVERLSRAVNANIKLLTTAPVQFAAERMGDTNKAVDLTTSGDPATQAANAAELQDRATRIRALTKQFGVPVPMRPLLQPEVKQLSTLLEGGSPGQVSDLMNDLRDNAGSSDVFRGIMAQVAPDQPVKAAAGVLASMQRDLTTGTHWFKPDDTITARDVAATMLEGDRLINRSSTAKAEDGKPQNRLVLPETKPLQEAFESVVGDNFRGDPQGKERAFQAAHAFYVGRVAQTGVRAKDGSSADKRLMELAVKSTLGDIVNFNSHGNVQAPWGMSGGDFEDRAERAIRSQAKTAGIADKDVNENIRALGLDNGPSDGIYVLTRAGQWLYDGRGNPVLIDIRPPDARDARGIIKRNGQ